MASAIGRAIQNVIHPVVHPKTENPLLLSTESEVKRGPEMMKSLQWHGAKDMRVLPCLRPHVTDPTDVVLRITTTTVCGSDLHMYLNEVPAAKPMMAGDIMGHEGVGIVDEVGPEVKNLRKGDRVCIAFAIACGQCDYCKRQEFSCCDKTNPSKQMEKLYGHRTAGIFGYSHLTGGFQGAHAEFLRVPFADVNCLKLPDSIPDDLALLLSDVACTGWHGNELAEVSPGHVVAVWGCGPIGLMIAKWAKFRGAAKVIAIDDVPHRLDMARDISQADFTINFASEDVMEKLQAYAPGGPDCCIDAAGFRFPKSLSHRLQSMLKMETDSMDIIQEMIYNVRKAGHVALIGDYFGYGNQFPIGAFMEKGLTMRGGQAFPQKYWHQLLEFIQSGRVDLSPFITHRMHLSQGDEAFKIFNEYRPDTIKIAIKTDFADEVPQARATVRDWMSQSQSR